MKLAEAIKVRLREGQAAIYAAEAESRGVGISTYIRERLEEADSRREELASIRAALIELGNKVDELRDQCVGTGNNANAQVQTEPATPTAVQIETLMLLRAIASPEKLRMIRGELDRQGIEMWAGQSAIRPTIT